MISKRKPTADDESIIQLIHAELLPLAIERFPHILFHHDEMIQRLNNGITYTWHDRHGHITGFIHVFTQDRILWLDMIAIERRHQGKGIGRSLVHHMKLYAKAHRLDGISLYVDKSNGKALKFYRSLGFRMIQYHPNIYCYELSKRL